MSASDGMSWSSSGAFAASVGAVGSGGQSSGIGRGASTGGRGSSRSGNAVGEPVVICVPRRKRKRSVDDDESYLPPQQLYCRIPKRKKLEDAFSNALSLSHQQQQQQPERVSMLCTLVDSVASTAVKKVGGARSAAGVDAGAEANASLLNKLRTVRGGAPTPDRAERTAPPSLDMCIWNAFHFGHMDEMMRLVEGDPESCVSYKRAQADGVTALMAACATVIRMLLPSF